MNLIEFTGMKRSGNHAIILWMMRNIAQTTELDIVNPKSTYASHNCIFFNCLNHKKIDKDPMRGKNHCDELKRLEIENELSKRTYDWYIVSYEDCHIGTKYNWLPYKFEKTYKFSIVRDINSVIASRLKRVEDFYKLYNKIDYDMEIYPSFFEHYMSHKNWPNVIYYDKWLTDKNYRDSICKILNVSNLDYKLECTVFGEGSSFTGFKLDSVENLLNRKSMYKIPDKYLNKIKELNL